tara:strand:+ start:100 stop:339 length:240 start_codon:yes stop_codon:yes gene_type:complete
MPKVTYEQEVLIGFGNEQLMSFEVDYYLCPTDGDVVIEDYYVEAVSIDSNDYRSVEKVPNWLHDLLKSDIEDYKYEMLA